MEKGCGEADKATNKLTQKSVFATNSASHVEDCVCMMDEVKQEAHRTDSKSVHEILDFADKAMYESKRAGRNRVTAWPISSNVSKVAHT